MAQVIEICIVGAGPAGLAAATSLIEAAKKTPAVEFRIHLIEKRIEFTRRQKLIIPKEKDLPAKELRWDKYCKELFDPTDQLQINDQGDLLDVKKGLLSNLNKRQKLLRKLMRQRDEFNEPKNFSIRSLQEALKEHIDNHEVANVKLHWHLGDEVKAVDLNKQKVVLDKDAIPFDYLLICEGEKRLLTQKINQTIPTECTSIAPFRYKKMGTPSHHMAARLTLKPLGSEKNYHGFLAQHRKKINFDVKNLKSLGWDPKAEKPEAIFDDNLYKEKQYPDPSWKPRLFIATPIPESLHKITNTSIKRNKLLEWASFFAASRLQVPHENFVIDEKGENESVSNVGTFLSDIHYVDNPVRKLPNGGHILLLGDSAMSPYYPLGTSSAFAMYEAKLAAICIARFHQFEGQFELLTAKYREYQKIIADHIGYRNQEIELIIEHIKELVGILQNEVNVLPVSTREDLLLTMRRQNIVLLLNKLCHELTECSNSSNTGMTLKGCLERLLMSDDAYIDAIELEPRVVELFDKMNNGQLVKELIQKQNSSEIKL